MGVVIISPGFNSKSDTPKTARLLASEPELVKTISSDLALMNRAIIFLDSSILLLATMPESLKEDGLPKSSVALFISFLTRGSRGVAAA